MCTRTVKFLFLMQVESTGIQNRPQVSYTAKRFILKYKKTNYLSFFF